MVHEYIGSKITIISRNSKRYEGILHSIDVDKSTITLKDVRYFENDENGEPTPASNVFEMIVFRGSDITDLAVCQPVGEKPKNDSNIPQDPAIISITEGNSKTLSDNTKDQNIQQNNNLKRNVGSKVNGELPRSSNNKFGNPPSSNNTVNSTRTGNNATNSYGKNGYRGDNTRNRQRNNGSGGRSSYRSGSNNTNYRGNSGGHYQQRSFVVGELKARVNQALKAELDTEFDFSEQNKKFEKSSFNKDLDLNKGSNGIKISNSGGGIDSISSATNGNLNNREQSSAASDNSNESSTLKVGGYDKVSGFFDSISCETLDPERSKKTQGSSDQNLKALREKQKMIDKETFGTSFVRPRGGYRSNNRRGRNKYNGKRS